MLKNKCAQKDFVIKLNSNLAVNIIVFTASFDLISS